MIIVSRHVRYLISKNWVYCTDGGFKCPLSNTSRSGQKNHNKDSHYATSTLKTNSYDSNVDFQRQQMIRNGTDGLFTVAHRSSTLTCFSSKRGVTYKPPVSMQLLNLTQKPINASYKQRLNQTGHKGWQRKLCFPPVLPGRCRTPAPWVCVRTLPFLLFGGCHSR